MNIDNLLIGLIVFLIIGIFHPIVIKAEYYFSKRIWPVFAVVGMLFAVMALIIDGNVGLICSILSFTCFWSINEIIEQDERVKKGWFKAGKHHQTTAHHALNEYK